MKKLKRLKTFLKIIRLPVARKLLTWVRDTAEKIHVRLFLSTGTSGIGVECMGARWSSGGRDRFAVDSRSMEIGE